jgi:hypothetical protein
MFGPMKMLGRVFILRRVTTADMAAREAKAKMHPSIAHF